MAPYMRIRAVLFAFCLAPTTLCNASPAATSPSPDACQIIPMDQIRGLLAATTETINPMSSQLQPDHSRCTYTLIMKDIDDKVTTNRLTVDYLRFPTPGQAIRAQHAMAHVGWTNNDGSMPLDIPTTSAVNDDEVVLRLRRILLLALRRSPEDVINSFLLLSHSTPAGRHVEVGCASPGSFTQDAA